MTYSQEKLVILGTSTQVMTVQAHIETHTEAELCELPFHSPMGTCTLCRVVYTALYISASSIYVHMCMHIYVHVCTYISIHVHICM